MIDGKIEKWTRRAESKLSLHVAQPASDINQKHAVVPSLVTVLRDPVPRHGATKQELLSSDTSPVQYRVEYQAILTGANASASKRGRADFTHPTVT